MTAGVISNDKVEKSVRIVLTSSLVNQPRFSKTMRDSLEPRLRQVAAPQACSCSSYVAADLPLVA